MNKELAETKRENHRLKRQVSKLQKYVHKLLDQGPASVTPDDAHAPLDNSLDCPSCQSPVKTVNLGFRSLRACKACGWRQVA